jgi:hypothetical protein
MRFDKVTSGLPHDRPTTSAKFRLLFICAQNVQILHVIFKFYFTLGDDILDNMRLQRNLLPVNNPCIGPEQQQ